MAWEQEAFVRSLSSLSANTIDAYRRDVRDFVGWAERAQLAGPAAVDRLVLRRYLSYLTTRRMAKRTIARKAAALRRYFAWLTRTGAVPNDPARRLSAPKGEGRLPHVLKPEELDTLLTEGPADGPVGRATGRCWSSSTAAGCGSGSSARSGRSTSTWSGASSWCGARGRSNASSR